MVGNVDWIKIKNEYITTNISQRKLADKYAVSVNTLMKRANKEDWTADKEKQYSKIIEKVQQKTVDKISDEQSDYIVNIIKINFGLADIIDKVIKQKNVHKTLKSNDIKALTGALKDIKDIQTANNQGEDTKKLVELRSIFEDIKNAD